MPYQLICRHCGKAVIKPYRDAVYCSFECSQRAKAQLGRQAIHAKIRAKRGEPIIVGTTARITLNDGHYVHVDVEDLALVGSYNWRANDRGYAVWLKNRNKDKSSESSHLRMHNLIMEAMLKRKLEPNEFVDHIDGDPRNNRRSNLRLASRYSNSWNTRLKKKNTSGYRGVCWDKSRAKWKAEIRCMDTKFLIGRFDDPEEAAWMRDQWTMALHGDFGILNFEYSPAKNGD